MILQNEMISIKSKEEVIRSICFEFNHFSVDQMDILKSVISDYTKTDRAIFTRGKSCEIKVGEAFVENKLLKEGIRIYEELLQNIEIELHLFGKPNKKCLLYVKAPVNIVGVDSKHIKQCIKKITKKIGEDISFRLEKIDSVEIKKGFFVQDIEIWDGDFSGKYDFGTMKIDFGYPNPNRQKAKVARCHIGYKQYRIELLGQPIFSFIARESKINLTLLQCFLRFPLYELSGEEMFFPSDIFGNGICVNRDDFRIDYICDKINNSLVPNDVSDLFGMYMQLEEKAQNMFFNAASLYCEGLKLEGTKAVSYYMICIETIASYEAKLAGKTDINKIDMIYEFLQTTFTKSSLAHKSVEELYSIRSAYVHNGIANNDFLDEVFMKSLISNSYCEIIERIANYALIQWLKKK